MESYLKDALNQSEKVNFKYFIKLAIKKEITWKALEDLFDDLTPTLIKSKQLNKALLKELQNQNQNLAQVEFKSKLFQQDNDEEFDQSNVKFNTYLMNCMICDETFTNVSAYESHVETHKSLEEESSENEGLEDYSNELENTDFELQSLSEVYFEDYKDSTLKQTETETVKVKPRKVVPKKEKEYIFKCSYCIKYFTANAMLRRHEKIHTGEKPYQCDSCLKCFTQLSHLKSHEKIHTGERPFQCKICGKSFPQKGHLKGHEITHTDEKPFECTVCGKCFNVPGGLKRHKQIHFR